jgi:3-keto-disaccharide hydrolase
MRWLTPALSFLFVAIPVSAQTKGNNTKEDGFVPLFNGKNLSGWKSFAGDARAWTVEDGKIICSGKNGGWLGTEREYDNFVLRLEYRLSPGGNSGVYIRAPEMGHISQVGMEIQLLDDAHPRYAKLKPYQYTGSVYGVVGPSRRPGKPGGQWNTIEIRAEGRRVTVSVNGVSVVDANLDQYLQNPAVAKEHTGLKRATGHIGLQSHTDRVEYRNLRIKPLKK